MQEACGRSLARAAIGKLRKGKEKRLRLPRPDEASYYRAPTNRDGTKKARDAYHGIRDGRPRLVIGFPSSWLIQRFGASMIWEKFQAPLVVGFLDAERALSIENR
jgi:hypothetical protein